MHAESFHAVALSASRRIVALRSQFPLVAEDADTTWVHCAKEGTWKGHPMGPVTFTKKVFEQIKKNFERQTNALPVRFEHPDYLPDGKPILTAGYIHKFEIRPKGLYAFVEFTPDGAKLVKAHHYKSCSLVVVFNSKDRVTNEDIGAEVLELGLTAIPFIDGLDVIQLSRAFARQARRFAMAKENTDQRDADALWKEAKKRAGEDASPRKLLEMYTALVEFEEKMSGAGGDTEPPKEEPTEQSLLSDPPDDDSVELSESQPGESTALADEATTGLALEALTILEQATGLPAAEAVQWLRDNASTLKGAGNVGSTADSAFSRRLRAAEGRITALTKERDAMGTKLSKIEADTKAKLEADEQKAAENEVDALIEAGKALDVERDDLVWLARTDRKRFDSWVSKRGSVVPTERVTADNPKKLSRKGGNAQANDDADLEPRDDVERAIVELNSSVKDRASVLARHRAKVARAH